MLVLLGLPFILLQVGLYALPGLLDSLAGCSLLRAEATTLINAPRAVVRRFMTVDHGFRRPPVTEMATEPLADGSDLWLTRVSVNGQEWGRVVSRRIARDEAKGILLGQTIAHELSHPWRLQRNAASARWSKDARTARRSPS